MQIIAMLGALALGLFAVFSVVHAQGHYDWLSIGFAVFIVVCVGGVIAEMIYEKLKGS